MPNWFLIWQAALATLNAGVSAAGGIFHGGAANTVAKIASATSVVTAFTQNVAAGLHPATGVDLATVHPDLVAHAAQLGNAPAAAPAAQAA